MAKRPHTTKDEHAAICGRRGFLFSGASVAVATTVVFDSGHLAPDPHAECWAKLLKIQSAFDAPVAPEAEARRNAKLTDKEDRILARMASMPVTSRAGALAQARAAARYADLRVSRKLLASLTDFLASPA